MAAVTNSSLIPSPNDLLMAFPRLAQKVGTFAFFHMPEQVDAVLNKIMNGGSIIADATATNVTTASITTASSAFAQDTAAALAAQDPLDSGFFAWMADAINFEGFRGFGGMLSYFGSRWALATFMVSIFLNRTHFYASSRQNLHIQWRSRLFLYSVPIVLLLTQTLWVLQAMRCQTSPDYPLLRYGDPAKNMAINFGADGGFMYKLSSTLLFWQDDSTSCSAMNMALHDGNKLNVMGSFAFVWPFFVTLCISQFVETLSCALQGRQPLPETGMTTFEHSLAFAECEAMISNALGLGIFGSSKGPKTSDSSAGGTDTTGAVLLTRSMILRRLNVPSEVLLISFISCLSHLSSSILAVTGYRQRFRLINTGIWALCYMAAFVWSLVRVMGDPLGSENDLGILRFPTVCIIGFIPHLLILFGILICACIYGFALLVTAISLPPDAPPNPSIKQRFSIAFHNLQANVQFSASSSIRLNWQEDFYTTLLKVGFNVLTAASEAVYLNEGNRIRISELTWLEEKRIQELAYGVESRSPLKNVPPEILGQSIAKGVGFTDHPTFDSPSGYAKERKSTSIKGSDMSRSGGLDSGLGLAERRSRWQLVLEFFRGILLLCLRMWARFTVMIMEKIGIGRRPGWLQRHAETAASMKKHSKKSKKNGRKQRDYWIMSPEGKMPLPNDGNLDVEAETRRRLEAHSTHVPEDVVDTNLYTWWKTGGWWGDVDTSGEYQDADVEDDLTSVMSMSTNASEAGSDEEEDSGRRTPTQEEPFPSRESSVDRTFGISDLARLLNPKTAEDREEAQLLSRHLASERPMTRSQYQKRTNQDKARILTVQRYRHGNVTSSGPTIDTDEEEQLEQFILERRARAQAKNTQGGAWDAGAEGMGSGGPQCVVCQSSPRVILVWPCGCLSICDDCRVGVAARNFNNCLCCRTNVVAYSRLYVP